MPMMKLYSTPALPNFWIVDDGVRLFMVPSFRGGWTQRRTYLCNFDLTESLPQETRVMLGHLGVTNG